MVTSGKKHGNQRRSLKVSPSAQSRSIATRWGFLFNTPPWERRLEYIAMVSNL